MLGLEFVVFMDSCLNKSKNKKSRRDQSLNVFLFCSCVYQAYTGISTDLFVYDHVLLSILLKASFEMFCRESGSFTPPSKVRAPVEQVTFKLKLKTSCCLSSPKSIIDKIRRNVSTWRGGLAKASSRLFAASGGNPEQKLQNPLIFLIKTNLLVLGAGISCELA